MSTKVCTAIERPHLWGNPNCWCHPCMERCEDPAHADRDCFTLGHAYPEARPDIRPRMAVFSDRQ